jgi:hypothetical protein
MIAQGITKDSRKIRNASTSASNQPMSELSEATPHRHSKSNKYRHSTGGIQTFLTSNHPGVEEANVKMDHLVSSFVLRGGRPFNIVEDPDLRAMIKHARFIGHDYKFPDRKKISGDLLKLQYDQLYENNLDILQREADTFGLALYADGATISKTPYINILAAGAFLPNACLEIHDCTRRLVDGGKKDASYIKKIIEKHIDRLDPKKNLVDMVIFDGASNMQKAGEALTATFPLITCIHGSEHVISLFFSDVSKTRFGGAYVKIYKQIYKWFGGRHQAPYGIFMDCVQNHNSRKLGLIRASGTRMGGYWICWLRVLRLKTAFEAAVVSAKFRLLKGGQRPPDWMVKLFKDDFGTRPTKCCVSCMDPIESFAYVIPRFQ